MSCFWNLLSRGSMWKSWAAWPHSLLSERRLGTQEALPAAPSAPSPTPGAEAGQHQPISSGHAPPEDTGDTPPQALQQEPPGTAL